MSPNVELQLLTFLREQREADIVGTLKHLTNNLSVMSVSMAEFRAETHGQIRGLSLRVGELERDRDKVEKSLGESGQWNLQALEEKHNWSNRFIITTLVGVGIAVASGVVSVIITLLIKR